MTKLLDKEVEEIVQKLFTTNKGERMEIRHQGFGNCTPDNIRQSLTRYARAVVEEAMEELKYHEDITTEGYCLKQNLERLLGK